ncbi:unnamed protein product [Lactuca saligna]|uniref:Uncharacterized protein n=1 Tax=Lactuca saligna TaxID=75948 RepID=A0AA35Z1L5_LACSI|nr:unnamed protein product [Lactuca saligna]
MGSNNDINVLDQSTIFNDIYIGKSYDVSFQANKTSYKPGYHTGYHSVCKCFSLEAIEHSHNHRLFHFVLTFKQLYIDSSSVPLDSIYIDNLISGTEDFFVVGHHILVLTQVSVASYFQIPSFKIIFQVRQYGFEQNSLISPRSNFILEVLGLIMPMHCRGS